jgi:hypothetical protein
MGADGALNLKVTGEQYDATQAEPRRGCDPPSNDAAKGGR